MHYPSWAVSNFLFTAKLPHLHNRPPLTDNEVEIQRLSDWPRTEKSQSWASENQWVQTLQWPWTFAHWPSSDLHSFKLSLHLFLTPCFPLTFCCSDCMKTLMSWKERGGGCRITKMQGHKKDMLGYNLAGYCPWSPREESYSNPPNFRDVPLHLPLAPAKQSKAFGIAKASIILQIQYCIWNINTIQALYKQVHFVII